MYYSRPNSRWPSGNITCTTREVPKIFHYLDCSGSTPVVLAFISFFSFSFPFHLLCFHEKIASL